MSADQQSSLPPGVDLTVLAGLVAPLLAPQVTEAYGEYVDEVARRVAAVTVSELAPLVARIIDATVQRDRRGIGPYLPPPTSSSN